MPQLIMFPLFIARGHSTSTMNDSSNQTRNNMRCIVTFLWECVHHILLTTSWVVYSVVYRVITLLQIPTARRLLRWAWKKLLLQNLAKLLFQRYIRPVIQQQVGEDGWTPWALDNIAWYLGWMIAEPLMQWAAINLVQAAIILITSTMQLLGYP